MPDIEVRQYGGKDNLGPFLRALVATSSFQNVTSLGIFRDADQDRDQAFRSVAGALQGANLPTPESTTRRQWNKASGNRGDHSP